MLEATFSAYELRRLELAEQEFEGLAGSGCCPWGETAATLRMLYLADRVAGLWNNEKALQRAERILQRLLGPPPQRKKKRRS